MANVFDQFDQDPLDSAEANPFDQFDQLPSSQAPSEQSSVEQVSDEQLPEPEDGFLKNTADVGNELISAFNKGLVDIADMATANPINSILEIAGSNKRIPTFSDIPGSQGGYMEPGIARDVIQATGEISSGFVNPAKQAQNIAQDLPDLVAKEGFVSKAKELVRPVTEKVFGKPTAQTSRMEGTGIKATTGEIAQQSKDPKAFGKLKTENMLLEQSDEVGDAMRAFKKKQSDELQGYLQNIAPDQDADTVGKAIKEALDFRKSSVKYKRKQAYNKLASVSGDVDLQLSTEPLKSALNNALPTAMDRKAFATLSPKESKALNDVIESLDTEIPLAISNQEQVRKILGSIIDGADIEKKANVSRVVGSVKDALDNEFLMASKSLESMGNENIAAAAKAARNSHMALKAEFDPKGIVEKLISTKGKSSGISSIENSQVYSSLVASSVPIEQFDNIVNSLKRSGSKGVVASNQLKTNMVLDLLDSGFQAGSRKVQGDRVFGATPFIKRFDFLEPKLKSLMSPKEFNALKAMRSDVENLIPPSGAIPKGSAGFFIDILDKSGAFAVMNKIPGAGPIVANQVHKLGKSAQDAKQLQRALRDPKTKSMAKLINAEYPSLAAAFQISEEIEETIGQ